MDHPIPASWAVIGSAVVSLLVSFASKWYDKYIDKRYGAKKHLDEREIELAIEQSKRDGVVEGYAWTRMKELDSLVDALRRELSEVNARLVKTDDDCEEIRRERDRLTKRVEFFENQK